MPVNYTNHKGVAYTLYQGKTKTGKPRYYFGRADQRHDDDPVTELPAGYVISESVNSVVSLVKNRPSSISSEDVAAIHTALQKHPQTHHYRVAVKHNRIEVYELVGPDYNEIFGMLHEGSKPSTALARELQAVEERHAQYSPVLRFTLIDPAQRLFAVERMCYLGSIDGWLELGQTGPMKKLASALIPALGTDDFYDLI